MKFGQLIEYNMRNVFLEKSYIKYEEKNVSILKVKIEHMSV